jgi:thymidine kinase
MSGELHIIMGPMFSSKSSELIRQVEKYTACDIQVCVVNHELDTRYNTTSMSEHHFSGICTHDGRKQRGIQTSNLSELFEIHQYQNAKVVCIDEGNFFKNLYRDVLLMVERDHKVVYVAGLNGTYERKEFGELSHLLPIADSITMLQSICVDCNDGKTPAIFTKLRTDTKLKSTIDDPADLVKEIGNGKVEIQIGGKDKYKPVCRQHF